MADSYLCGIDAGSTTCKLVMLDDAREILHKNIKPIGGDPVGIIKACFSEAIKELKLKKKSVMVVITGRNGKDNPDFKNYQSELLSLSTAVYKLEPGARTSMDSGSFSNKVMKLDENGKINEYILNDICSSGSGIFIELVCKSLDISLDEMSNLALSTSNIVPVTSQCSIFAESEVIYLMNENKPLADIAAGVCSSIVGRLVPQVSKLNPEPKVIFSGGVSKNKAIIKMLGDKLGIEISQPTIDPQFVTAYGAALLAGNSSKGE